MIRIAITRSLILKKNDRNYDVGPGSYFAEMARMDGEVWLILEGSKAGMPLRKWLEIKNKGVKPKSFFAKLLFIRIRR